MKHSFVVKAALLLCGALASGALATKTAQAFTYDSSAPRPNQVPIKSTRYSVPASNVIYVSESGNCSPVSSSCGTSGTPTSLASAVSKVNGTTTRQTVIFASGTYRKARSLTFNNPVNLQPASNATAWLTGSDLIPSTSWTKDGSSNRWSTSTRPSGYGTQYGYEWDGTPDSAAGSDNPLAANNEQVFINGEPQVQVATKAEVTGGKFWVDYANHRLYIGTNPSGQTVEVTNARRAFNISGGSLVRGLGFRHYAESGITLSSPGVTVENCTFTWNRAGVTMFQNANDETFQGNSFVSNGQLGLNAQYNFTNDGTNLESMDNLVFQANYVAYNNVESFYRAQSAGGIKTGNVSNSTFRDNFISKNFGHGMWFDNSNLNNDVYRNAVIDNKEFGIFYEISALSTIAFNFCQGNGTGIAISGTNQCRVLNNTSVQNGTDLLVKDSGRLNDPDSDGGACGGNGKYGDDTNDGKDNPGFECGENDKATLGATWISSGNVIKDNILSDSSGSGGALLRANENFVDTQNGPIGQSVQTTHENSNLMFSTLDYNVYHRPSSSVPSLAVKWWSDAQNDYDTLSAFRSARGYESNGVALDNTTLFANSAANGFYRPAATAPNSVRSGGSGSAGTGYYADNSPLPGGFSNPWNGGGNGSDAYGLGAAPGSVGGNYRGAFKPVIGPPDLVIDSFTISPAKPKTDDEVTFTAVIRNAGDSATPNVAHGMNFTIGGESVAYVGNSFTGSLAPGATRTLTSDVSDGKNWKAERGTKTVTATVDNGNTITESDETNNTRTLSVTVDGLQVQAVNAGGGAVSPFSTDSGYSGGKAANPSAATINLSGVTNPAPEGVYQTTRYGTSGNGLTYSFEGLDAGKTYQVRLHFAEPYWSAADKRKFNVSINGAANVLSNFDIFAAAGAKNKAIVKEFEATANSSSQIAIAFGQGSVGDPTVSGIEILR